jgi:hypothetical protein
MFVAATIKVVHFEMCCLALPSTCVNGSQNPLPPSTWYKNEPLLQKDAANFAKTMTPIYLITPRLNPEDSNLINSSSNNRL